MHIYGYKNGVYTREIIIPEDEQIYTTETRIDCTKFKPGNDGAPVEIVVEQPIYVAPAGNDSVYTAAKDVLYGNSAGNDTIYGNLA